MYMTVLIYSSYGLSIHEPLVASPVSPVSEIHDHCLTSRYGIYLAKKRGLYVGLNRVFPSWPWAGGCSRACNIPEERPSVES